MIAILFMPPGGGMEIVMDKGENRANWRRIQVRVVVRAILIVLGALFMQMAALFICLMIAAGMAFAKGAEGRAEVVDIFSNYLKNEELLIWAALLSAVLMGIWCGILYRKSGWREEHIDYRRAFCPENVLSILGIGAGGCIFLSVLLSIVAAIVPEAFTSYNQVMDALTEDGAVANVLYVLLIGPVSEELIFRGAILDRFYIAFPFFVANILQAVLFGVYHMNLIQGLYAFFLGMALGLVRHATGSILGSILVHIIFNSTSWVSDVLLPETTPEWAIFLLTAAAGVSLLLGLRHMRAQVQRL